MAVILLFNVKNLIKYGGKIYMSVEYKTGYDCHTKLL